MTLRVIERLTRLTLVLGLALAAGFAAARPSVASAILGVQTHSRRPAPRDRVSILTPAELANGRKLFDGHCAYCHGIGGVGEKGPNLARPVLQLAPDNQALFKLIQNGIDGSEMPDAWQLSDREIWQVAGYVRSLGRRKLEAVPGSADKGRLVYESKGCDSCHIVRGKGGFLGPDLTDAGLRRSPAYLRAVLTDPGKSVPKGFLMVRVETKDGTELEGMRLNEDPFTIQLRDIGGAFHSFRKSDITQLEWETGKSPMPSYARSLAPSELDDLVAYLAGLRGEK
jgi:cytochrome c oxidase cbb3-type subunit III